MEKVKLFFVWSGILLMVIMSMFAFLFAMSDIFGKQFKWKDGTLAILMCWSVIGLYYLAVRLLKKINLRK